VVLRLMVNLGESTPRLGVKRRVENCISDLKSDASVVSALVLYFEIRRRPSTRDIGS
jgi:hypothetical protein